jgi:hypothetical protein
MLYKRGRELRNGMNRRWRLSGLANKPPCGAEDKIPSAGAGAKVLAMSRITTQRLD